MRKTILALFGLMMLFLAPALAAAQGKFTQAPAPVPTIGTCSGCARDGALATAQENSAISQAQAAQATANLALPASSASNLLLNNTVPLLQSYLGSVRVGLNTGNPLVLWSNPTTGNLDNLDIERNEYGISGSVSTAAQTIDFETGPNESNQEDALQVYTKDYSTTGSNVVVGTRDVLTREPGAISNIIALLVGCPDFSGLSTGTGTGQAKGTLTCAEIDNGATGLDQGPNASIWGGFGARNSFHFDYSQPGFPSITFTGQGSGTTLTTASPQALYVGSVFTGSGGVSATVVSETSPTSWQYTPSQNFAGEVLTDAPPPAGTVGEYKGTFFLTQDGTFFLDSLFNFKPNFQLGTAYSCLNLIPPAGWTVPVRCVDIASNQVLDLAGDLYTPHSQSSPPERFFTYNSATGCTEYHVRELSSGPAYSVCDNGLLTAYYNELISGNLTLGGWEAKTVAASVAAAGSTLATATALTAVHNKISSGAANTGVALPAGAPVGTDLWIYNRSGSAKEIWPDSTSDTIEGGTAGVGVVVQAGSDEHFVRDTSTDWLQ